MYQAAVMDAPKVALTETDLVTILRVAKETASDRTNPIFCIRGPEVAELFAMAFPERAAQIRKDFSRLQPLGTYRHVGEPSLSERSAPPSVRIFKRIEMMYADSPVFPGGVPVGLYDRATQAVAGVSNKFNDTGSQSEIDDEERKRVNALAFDLRYLTPRQVIEDEFRKQNARNARVETELDPTKATATIIGDALGPAIAQGMTLAMPMMLRALQEAGFKVTAPAAPAETPKS